MRSVGCEEGATDNIIYYLVFISASGEDEGPAEFGLIVQWLTSNRLFTVILVIYPNISVDLVASCRSRIWQQNPSQLSN